MSGLFGIEEGAPKTVDPQMDRIGRLFILSAIMGLMVGIISLGILMLAYGGIDLLSETVPENLPEPLSTLFPLILGVVAAITIGLSIRFTGEHTGLGVTQREYAEGGRVPYKYLPSTVVQSFISLWSGASIGPEGLLMDVTGSFGTWISEKIGVTKEDVKILTYTAIAGCFGGFFGSPVTGAIIALEYMFIKQLGYYRLILPGLISAAVGYCVFFLAAGDAISGMITFPEYEVPRIVDMIYAVPLALVAALFGMFHKVVFVSTHRMLGVFAGHPVTKALAGGIAFGVIGVVMPLTLFSGQDQLEVVLEEFMTMGVAMLLLLTLSKSFLTSISFASGFKGGPIFPLLFMGGTLGMTMALLFPFIPTGVCILVSMAAVLCTMAPMPISISLMLGAMSQPDLVPVIVVGAVIGFVVSKMLFPNQPTVEQMESIIKHQG